MDWWIWASIVVLGIALVTTVLVVLSQRGDDPGDDPGEWQ